MRLVARLLWMFATVVAVVGCNDVTTPTAAVSITTWEGAGAGENYGLPLEGVQVCELDTTHCVTTDANGETALELPLP